MKRIFLWTIIAVVLAWEVVQYWPVTVRICGSPPEEDFAIHMPLKDKKRLEYFFRDICFYNVWAYTLNGSKPMSCHHYIKPWIAFRNGIKRLNFDWFWPPNFREICYHLNPESLKTKLGCDTLNKYLQYFPNSRFVLFTSAPHEEGVVGLTLIDKIKLIKTIKQNLQDFQFVLKNQEIDPEELVDNEKLDRFLKSLRHNDVIEAFLGTLLGYGRENAWLFQKNHTANSTKKLMVSAWPEEEIVNIELLYEKEMSFQPWDLSVLFYPRFACDPESEETKQLKQIYREEREKIIKYYEGKDVVEATLSLFNRRLDGPN